VYLSPLPSCLFASAGRPALAETLIVAAGIYGIVRIVVALHYAWNVAALLPAAALICHRRWLLADHRR